MSLLIPVLPECLLSLCERIGSAVRFSGFLMNKPRFRYDNKYGVFLKNRFRVILN